MSESYQEIYDSLLIDRENLLKEIHNEYEIIKWSRNVLGVQSNAQISMAADKLNDKIQEHNQYVKEILPKEVHLLVQIIFIGF